MLVMQRPVPERLDLPGWKACRQRCVEALRLQASARDQLWKGKADSAVRRFRETPETPQPGRLWAAVAYQEMSRMAKRMPVRSGGLKEADWSYAAKKACERINHDLADTPRRTLWGLAQLWNSKFFSGEDRWWRRLQEIARRISDSTV